MSVRIVFAIACSGVLIPTAALGVLADDFPTGQNARDSFPITVESVTAAIDQRGPRILYEIYDDDECWNDFIEKIASGQNEWLEIALRCMDAADAHPSEELHGAFGAALKHNPDNCLQLAHTTGKASHRDLFATFPSYDYPTLDIPQTELKARIDAVMTVSSDDLASIKEECLADLRDELKAVRKEFGALEDELPEDSPYFVDCEVEMKASERSPEDPLCRELTSGPKHFRDTNDGDAGSETLEFYRLMIFESDDDIHTTDEDLFVFERVSAVVRSPMQWKRDPAIALKSVRGAGERVFTDLSGVDVIGWNAWNGVLIELNETHYLLTMTARDTIEVRRIAGSAASAEPGSCSFAGP